jgi:hypothetical protein
VVEASAWLSDLVGKTKPNLSACIKEPVANTNHRRGKKEKADRRSDYDGYRLVAQFRQAQVINRIGVGGDLAEKHQTRFKDTLL